MHSTIVHGFLIGLCGGFLGGLVGLGGGIIMIPLMVYILGYSQHTAHGNSLAAIVFTGISGAITYYMWRSIDVIASLFLSISAIFTARYGVKLASRLTSKKLRKYFGFFTIFVSSMLIFKDYLTQGVFHFNAPSAKAILLLTLGCFTGFLSGLFGIGGGTIMVPGLIVLLGMSQHIAQGTSLLAMIPTCLSGALSYYRFGHVDPKLVSGLSLGAIVGGPLGATVANLLPEFHLRVLFSLVLFWLALKFIRG